MLDGLQRMAAAQEQPTGKALPALVPAGAVSPEAFVEAARRVDPFEKALV